MLQSTPLPTRKLLGRKSRPMRERELARWTESTPCTTNNAQINAQPKNWVCTRGPHWCDAAHVKQIARSEGIF